ncbi:MAG TPA: iron ABC transporter substrate-binding protein [Methanocorpusculum sp.]|nr:iron ABC transporter substrate-binding protein [Methanocorpusculum sp.]
MTNNIIIMTEKKIVIGLFMIALITAVIFSAGCVNDVNNGGNHDGTITITDAAGREVIVPDNPQKIAVSGSGSSRYFAWLQVTDKLVAVDYLDSYQYVSKSESRPYMIANPEIKNHAALGAAKGVVDAEKLMSANPDILFMAGYSDTAIQNANEITEKTGIPVILFYSGDYVTNTAKVENSLRLIAKILHAEERAEAVIKYFKDTREDLESRVAGISDDSKPTVYVGGISHSGSHGITSSSKSYYEFTVLHAKNVAGSVSTTTSSGYADVSKEQILAWDPEIIFVDLSTMNAAGGGAIYELKTDPSYQELKAVKTGQIYAVNPHTSMGTNHETCMANAYYIGKVLYPKQFADIDPEKKADEIYTFIDGTLVYQQLKANKNGLSYQKIKL